MNLNQVLKKTPTEERLFDFDWVEDLDTGETISSSPAPVVTATPTGLTIEGIVISGARVQAKFKAGTAAQQYHVSCVIVTNTQKREACGDLYVEAC